MPVKTASFGDDFPWGKLIAAVGGGAVIWRAYRSGRFDDPLALASAALAVIAFFS
jgi:hypothetical protein